MNTKHIELLAPAGNLESLHAAVTAGADAVYLGVGSFNARRGADNFALDTLAEACDYAHLRGVKIYLTMNTIILPSELADALETARQAYRRGVDAFIVQDIGFASELLRVMPDAELHISTQMNIHTVAGLEAALELGAKRVTLARELSLKEINHLSVRAQELGLDLEVFAHGALCVSYSGQCFMSSMIGGRSANRGMCAQACRLPYELHNKALRKTLSADGMHLLSPKDLNTIELLPELIKAGVISFKIEGRMKSPEYVHTVTSVYRRALDQAITSSQTHAVASELDNADLGEVFSRGFTTAYLEGQRGNDIMSYGRPNNRGAFFGRVVSVDGRSVILDSKNEAHVGDVLEFWTSKGHFAHKIEALAFDQQGRLRLSIERAVGKGDRVFRVRSAELSFEDDPRQPRIPIRASVVMKRDQPLHLRAWLDESHHALSADESDQDSPEVFVEVEGPIMEAARTKAVTEQEVSEHIDRLGNTPFVLVALDVNLEDGIGVGFSQLHKIRTQALEALEKKILEPFSHRLIDKIQERDTHPVFSRNGCVVTAWASNPACARAAKRAGAEIIYVPATFYKRGQSVIAGQVSETAESAGYPKQSVIALPAVEHDMVDGSREHAQGVDVWDYAKPGKPLLVENLGQLVHARSITDQIEVGPHLPIINKAALQSIVDFGAQRVWLSPELSLEQVEEMGQGTPLSLGMTIIGSQELMITEHCVLMSQGPCNEDCFTCQRRKSPHYLKDRKGYELPVITDSLGRSHLYNAVVFDIAHTVPELVRAGITAVMVDTTMMNVAETTKAVERAVRARDIALKSGDRASKKEGATTGHLFRGVS